MLKNFRVSPANLMLHVKCKIFTVKNENHERTWNFGQFDVLFNFLPELVLSRSYLAGILKIIGFVMDLGNKHRIPFNLMYYVNTFGTCS